MEHENVKIDEGVNEDEGKSIEDEELCIRKVGRQWGTVTLPTELKDNKKVVFLKEISSGRIYVRGGNSGDKENSGGESV